MKNKNEPVADAIYRARCLKTLKGLGLPTDGWICEWIEDADEPEEVGNCLTLKGYQVR